MLEQRTIQEGIGLIEKYGVVEGLLIWAAIFTVVVVGYNIITARWTKKNAIDPISSINNEVTKLREEKAKIWQELHRLELELKDRIKYEWAENLLIPKMDALSKDVSRLSANVEVQTKANEHVAKALENLVVTINRHSDRINALES